MNPNRFVLTPKLASPVFNHGFHSAVGRPLNVGPQPVAPAGVEKYKFDAGRRAVVKNLAWVSEVHRT